MMYIGLNHHRRVVLATTLFRNGKYLHKEDADHEIIEEIPTAHSHSIPTKVSRVHQAFDAF